MHSASDLSITTVIAAYNAERHICQALRSAMRQSVRENKIIVCDDASSDRTVEVVAAIENGPIKIIFNNKNLGPGPSRDRAIEHAESQWVALLDADDTWHCERLRRLLAAAVSTGADVVFDDTLLCHEVRGRLVPWKRLHGTRAFGGKGTAARIVRIEDYITSARLLAHPLISTDFIRRHEIEHSSRRFAEDAEFYLRLALAGAKFCYVPEPLYHYRITPGSLTAQARDPTLMRKCLEECAQWVGWWPSAQAAFQKKAASLRINESLYHLGEAVRRGHFSTASGLLLSHPQLFAQLPRRLIHQVHYHAHRLIHGGSRR
mgnify:CR=1 FL=1